MEMFMEKFKTQSIQCSLSDKISIRGGTYPEGSITITPSKHGSFWQEGEYNTLAFYPGEWVDTYNLRNGGEGQVGRPSSPSGFRYIQ